MKTVVITGATSSIGVALVKTCLSEGCYVIALTRLDSEHNVRLPDSKQLKLVQFDLRQGTDFPLIDVPCDVFYHLAWCGTGKSKRSDIALQAKNIQYTLNVIKLAKRLGCKKFVGAGSQAEYGQHYLPQTGPDDPVRPDTAYGISKYTAGRLGGLLASQLEMDYFWVRVFSVYGENDLPDTMIHTSLVKMKAGIECSFTAGTHFWDYLYSADAGRAFYLIGEKSVGNKIYCLGSGKARPLKQYICEMRDIVNPNLDLKFGEIPYSGGNGMSMCANIAALQRDTAWKPEVEFQEGIKNILNSFRNGEV